MRINSLGYRWVLVTAINLVWCDSNIQSVIKGNNWIVTEKLYCIENEFAFFPKVHLSGPRSQLCIKTVWIKLGFHGANHFPLPVDYLHEL